MTDGFVGLGHLGRHLSASLVRAGFDVAVGVAHRPLGFPLTLVG